MTNEREENSNILLLVGPPRKKCARLGFLLRGIL